MVTKFGNGTIVGSAGDDTLFGGNADDTLIGGGGNDYLYGGDGSDTMLGGAGDDNIRSDSFDTIEQDVLIDGGSGSDLAEIYWYNYTIPIVLDFTDPLLDQVVGATAIRGIERINFIGGQGDDIVTGGALDDSLRGNGGHNVLNGGGGNDYFSTGIPYDGSGGHDELDGGDGIDLLNYFAYGATAPITLSLADPTSIQTIGDTTLHNIERLDFYGGQYADIVTGGVYDDRLDGSQGDDILDGGGGNDTIDGGTGNNILYGGAGDDDLTTYIGGITLIDGGEGTDLATVSMNDTPIDFTLDESKASQQVGDVTLISIEQIKLYAGSGSDRITGGALADAIYGGYGYDYISGGDGDDTLDAGYGYDHVDAGAGNDTIYTRDMGDKIDGGAGYDTLVLGRVGEGRSIIFTLGDPTVDSVSGALAVRGVEALQLVGGRKNDVVTGGAENDSLHGGFGDDILNGGDGDDILTGDFGNDMLSGGKGNDSLSDPWGLNSLYGDDGDDTISVRIAAFETASAVIDGGGGTDLADIVYHGGRYGQVGLTLSIADPSVDHMIGATILRGVERMSFTGSYGNDTVTGGSLNDGLYGNAGDDRLAGGGGSDYLEGGQGRDTLLGDDGDDVLRSQYAVDNLASQYRYDILLDGGRGTDKAIIDLAHSALGVTLNLGLSEDQLVATTIVRNIEQVDFKGSNGNDIVTGGALADTIDGGSGVDLLSGGGGDDMLTGANGDDVLTGGVGDDSIFGGAGADTLVMSGVRSNYLFVVNGEDGMGAVVTDQRVGGDGVDHIYDVESVRFADGTVSIQALLGLEPPKPPSQILDGDSGANTIAGGDGDDVLRGIGGDDWLIGGSGDDTLIGGTGKDRLTGGDGADTFVFGAGDAGTGYSARDLIKDFQSGEDHIDLTAFGPDMLYSTSFIGSSWYINIDTDGDGFRNMDIQVQTSSSLTSDDILV